MIPTHLKEFRAKSAFVHFCEIEKIDFKVSISYRKHRASCHFNTGSGMPETARIVKILGQDENSTLSLQLQLIFAKNGLGHFLRGALHFAKKKR